MHIEKLVLFDNLPNERKNLVLGYKQILLALLFISHNILGVTRTVVHMTFAIIDDDVISYVLIILVQHDLFLFYRLGLPIVKHGVV